MPDRIETVDSMQKDSGTILAEKRTNLALHRTVIAAERTLMAWIRTALSLIGFGFTIYKFFEYLPQESAAGSIRRAHSPRNLGMALIALGTLGLVAAAWQHRSFLNELGVSQKRHIWSISFMVAILVVLIGIITFFDVLMRTGPF